MSYLDDLAGQIEHEVPADLPPKQDATLLFHRYALLLLAKGTVAGRVNGDPG